MADYTLRARFGADLTEFNRGVQQFQQGIANAQGATNRLGSSSANSAMFARQLGYAMNDAQQFAYGFRQGLVALSNQVDGLIIGFGEMRRQATESKTSLMAVAAQSLRGGNGLIIALNLAISAAAIFGPAIARAFRQTEDAANDASDAYRDALQALNAFRSGAVQTARLSAQTLQSLFSASQGQIQALSAQLRTLRDQRDEADPRGGDRGGGLTGRAGGDVAEFTRLSGLITTVEANLAAATGEANAFRDALNRAQDVIRASVRSEQLLGGALPVIGEQDTDEGGGRRTRRGPSAEELERRARAAAVALKELAKAGTPENQANADGWKRVAKGIQDVGVSATDTEPKVRKFADEMLRAVQVVGDGGNNKASKIEEATDQWAKLGGTLDSLANSSISSIADGFSRLFTEGKGDARSFGAAVSRVFADITRSIAQAVTRMLVFRALFALFGGSQINFVKGFAGGSVTNQVLGGGLVQAGPSSLTAGGDVIVRLRAVDVLASQRRGLQMERAAGLAGSL